jgi:hypothetical protein
MGFLKLYQVRFLFIFVRNMYDNVQFAAGFHLI